MVKEEASNQLNLTVVALVALVAIVGLVALVMNAASIAKLPTGSQIVSAENVAGDARMYKDTSRIGTSSGQNCGKEGATCDTKNPCCTGLTCTGRNDKTCVGSW